MKIARTGQTSPYSQKPPASPTLAQQDKACAHSGHHHTTATDSFLPRVRESFVELPHAAMELLAGHDSDSVAIGSLSGAVGILAAVRGVQNFQTGGAIHTVEGLGSFALAASSGLTAFQTFKNAHEAHHHHGHDHGHALSSLEHHHNPLISALEVSHGLAEIVVGGLELREDTPKPAVSLLRIAKGSAAIAAQLLPTIAQPALLAKFGLTAAIAVLDPKH